MRNLYAATLIALLAACAAGRGDESAREWQRAECDRVIDSDARARCLKRVDEDYGRRKGDSDTPRK